MVSIHNKGLKGDFSYQIRKIPYQIRKIPSNKKNSLSNKKNILSMENPEEIVNSILRSIKVENSFNVGDNFPFGLFHPEKEGNLTWVCGEDEEGKITSVYCCKGEDPDRVCAYLDSKEKAIEVRDELMKHGWQKIKPPEVQFQLSDGSYTSTSTPTPASSPTTVQPQYEHIRADTRRRSNPRPKSNHKKKQKDDSNVIIFRR